MEKALFNFSVQVYGDFVKYSETISQGRCRIFYKGPNRNGSYITAEFAEKLLSSLPYTPVKGIYYPEEDFQGHGYSSAMGRIYGVVPENPNVTWEEHYDSDGEIRKYACCDILIYTALYEEAKEVFSKGQSMELYPPSIKGSWVKHDGIEYYEYTDGCFFGLQVLGDEFEPCFEGATFFTLKDKVEEAFKKLEKLRQNFEKEKGGHTEMHKMNFKLSEGQLYLNLFMLLNPNFTEEGNWEVKYGICEVSDEYALVRNYETGNYEKVKFQLIEDGNEAEDKKENVEEKKDEVELGEFSACYMITVSESEQTSLNSTKELNNGSFEKIDEVFAKIPKLESEVVEIEKINSSFEQEIAEKDATISDLETEKNSLDEELTTLKANYENFEKELNELKKYKSAIEINDKQKVIDKYSSLIDAEILNKYSAESEISIEELEKNLAFELVKSNNSLFEVDDGKGGLPIEVTPTGLEAVLLKHKKN